MNRMNLSGGKESPSTPKQKENKASAGLRAIKQMCDSKMNRKWPRNFKWFHPNNNNKSPA